MSILLYNVGSENVGKVKHPTLQGYCALEIGVAVHVACKPILFLSAQFLTIVQFGAKSVHLAALQVLQTWYFPCHEVAIAVLISVLFLIFCFLMRIQELRELSFKLSYLLLVYPTFFLMRLSVASVVFVSGA